MTSRPGTDHGPDVAGPPRGGVSDAASIGSASIGSPSTGSPSAGSPSAGSPSAGSASAGSASAGSASAGSPSAGSPSAGSASAGSASVDPFGGTVDDAVTGRPAAGAPADGSRREDVPAVETPWRRLDTRMLVVGPLGNLVGLAPFVVILLVTGQGELGRLWFAVGVAVLLVAFGVLRWRTTRYRITDERVELHTGFFNRQRRSVPRDRIRTVDLTAKLLHRVFGLSVVQVSAASGAMLENSGLSLDAVSKPEAERLRLALLARSPAAAGVATDGAGRSRVPGDGAPVTSGAGGAAMPDVGGAAATSVGGAAATSDGGAAATSVGGAAATSDGGAAATSVGGAAGTGVGGAAATADQGVVAGGVAASGAELARLRWSWIRYAPLTASSLVAVGAVVGTVFNWVDDIGLDLTREVIDATGRVTGAPLLGVAVVVGTFLGIAVVGAVLLFAERWYGYRLTREPDGTLRVKRGLLTRRSLSVSEERLRGVELSEPLLLRAGRGGQTRALSTGISRDASGGALGPPAPLAEGHRVASAVLQEEPTQITLAPLRRHPRAALVRRLNRALLTALLLVGGVWTLDTYLFGTGWAGPLAVAVLLPVAALLGFDRYRNLGHTLTERYVVGRRGSLRRRTVALQRAGVIGWTFRQSIFQRRAGLVTLEAVTAAGEGGYEIPDLAATDAVTLADAALPTLLTPLRP